MHPAPRPLWARTALATAIGVLGTCAQAQTAEPAATELETVTVVGETARIQSALEQQREADQIESVVHADGIAQLPDDNAAEALQRLPGVSVERDQGEGRFVIVRGLGPDLNTVTINGTQMPAPEAGRRAVALDVLPSELVQSLTVVKTLTPDMDANSLGGTIEVESLSAFDHEGAFNTLTVEGGYDGNTDQISPRGSGAFTRRFKVGEGELGVAAALSWQRRDFGSNNIETGGAWDDDKLEEVEMRDYRIRRDRTGLGLNFDYRPDNGRGKYYLRTLYSRYSDTELRNSSKLSFEEAVAAGETGTGEGERGVKSRNETQKVASIVLGGEQRFGDWKVSAQGGWSRAQEKNPGGITDSAFVSEDAFDASFNNGRRPSLNVGSAYYDANSYTLDSVEWEKQKTTDTARELRLDVGRDYRLAGMVGTLTVGGKIIRRDKTNELEAWKYEDLGDYGYSDASLNMSRFATGELRDKLGRFGPGISASSLNAFIGGLNRDDFYNEEDSRVNDYRIEEDINAAYVMNRFDTERWTWIGGIRYEGSRTRSQGTGLNDGTFENISRKRSDDRWLPGLHARYRVNENTDIRAAWTNTVVRPTFEQMAPGFVIDGDEAAFGNPDLKPLKSMNFDLGVEHYFGPASMVSAYVFYKDIKDFIYASDLAGLGDYQDFSQAETFSNGRSAKIYGLELAYTQKMDWLPSPWNGLIAGANATFSHADARIDQNIDGVSSSRRIRLPNQSNLVGNVMLGWENEQVSVRVAANYKSKYLSEVSASSSDNDLYADAQLFVDLTARWRMNKNLQFYFSAQNLTNEKYYVYTGRPGRNAQYEEYGPIYKLGMTMVF